ncbi:uncharacterized protein LOC134816732 [Bolinopsis microptera]|uniref:uncharacterized protein LOC134816732 n=1 Tax=Bolinopsis microptera TaxID=2820187 RepID=UPI003079B312
MTPLLTTIWDAFRQLLCCAQPKDKLAETHDLGEDNQKGLIFKNPTTDSPTYTPQTNGSIPHLEHNKSRDLHTPPTAVVNLETVQIELCETESETKQCSDTDDMLTTALSKKGARKTGHLSVFQAPSVTGHLSVFQAPSVTGHLSVFQAPSARKTSCRGGGRYEGKVVTKGGSVEFPIKNISNLVKTTWMQKIEASLGRLPCWMFYFEGTLSHLLSSL